jgi:hypothetical protein
VEGRPWEHEQGRLLSKPVKVHWLGWETDTYRLQQAGWELSMDQDYCGRRMRMVCRHQSEHFIGQTNDIPMELARGPYEDIPYHHIWQMSHLGREIRVHERGPISAYANFKAVDAKPQLNFERVTSLEDLVPFAGAPIVRNQALILPEATVDDLLKEILDRQEDAKMAYFEDLVQREGDAERAPPKFHAQIISLGDYRKAA